MYHCPSKWANLVNLSQVKLGLNIKLINQNYFFLGNGVKVFAKGINYA